MNIQRGTTDNDAGMFETKVELRARLIRNKTSVTVLEAFSGDGLIWDQIKSMYPEKEIRILRIDVKTDKKGTYLKGDNLKFLSSMDLSVFDIVDLDAYGSPFEQLQILFKRKFTGSVVCTFIQIMSQSGINYRLLNELGYTSKMIRKCPSIFNFNGFEKMKQYLANRKIKKLVYFSENRKNYFSFFMK